jgi:hypothetical protein
MLWIEDFPIDNTPKDSGVSGFGGTVGEIIEMLEGFVLNLNESRKKQLIKRKFATLSENNNMGINKRYIITEKYSKEEQKNRWKELCENESFSDIQDYDNEISRETYSQEFNQEFEDNNQSVESDLSNTCFSGEEEGFLDVPKCKGSMVVFRLAESDVKKNKVYIKDHFTNKLVKNPLFGLCKNKSFLSEENGKKKSYNYLAYSFYQMFFDFLKDRDEEKLFKRLDRIEKIAKDDGNDFLTIRFGETPSLYTIREIKKDVQLPDSHPNKKLLLELMETVKEIDPKYEIKVY